MQSGLVKSIASTAKVPSSSTNTSPAKSQTKSPQSHQVISPPLAHQQPPQSQQSQQIQSTKQQQSSTTITNYGQPLTTLANGFGSSIPPISTTHPISTPHIASPISNQTAITNGNTPTNLSAIAQPPASLPVGLPHPPPATAPTALTPSTHPSLDSSTSGRTNSPAVATSAVLSAVAPTANGNSNATTVAANGNIGPYRSAYPPYQLYAPYSPFHHQHHSSPYIQPPIPSPSASPRTVDSRTSRESPLVNNSKGIRPITPTTINNGVSSQLPIAQAAQTMGGSQPMNLREQSLIHQTHSAILSLQKAHSPRGHSPTRERDSYR